ncbi:hypothetical protein MTR67_002345 [Solanum verrucosum]|uniref:Ubiquitin-like protease family profile domain-containing protein n=1 Tax=Solanum verrucosum TaxID=315347 RepID=A0AAF0PS89_SOLVR|nr:hypothetical protein MTR67_002345 [Solanum verrucosum]
MYYRLSRAEGDSKSMEEKEKEKEKEEEEKEKEQEKKKEKEKVKKKAKEKERKKKKEKKAEVVSCDVKQQYPFEVFESYKGKKKSHPFEVIHVTGIAQQASNSLDCGVFVAAYTEFLSDGLQIPSDGIISQSLRLRYASLLWNYWILKTRSGYVSNNEDSQRPRPKKAKFDENIVVTTID